MRAQALAPVLLTGLGAWVRAGAAGLRRAPLQPDDVGAAVARASTVKPYCETDGVQVWLQEGGARDLGFRRHDHEDTTDWLQNMDQTSVQCVGAGAPAKSELGLSSRQASDDAPTPSCRDPQALAGLQPCRADCSSLQFAYQRRVAEVVLGGCASNPRVLLIGLGGGSLPMYLRQGCNGTEGTLTAESVELDPEVVFVAQHYLGFEPDDLNQIEVADAEAAVNERVPKGEQYDFAFVDCFGADGRVPEPCRSQRLLDGIHTILKPGGKVLQNVYGDQEPELERAYQGVFGAAQVQVAHNKLSGALLMSTK